MPEELEPIVELDDGVEDVDTEDLDLEDNGAPDLDAEPEDPWSPYGGKETVDQAYKIHQALQSQDGIIQLFFEAGQSMGLGLKEMNALFGNVSPEETVDEGPADDELVTWAQARALLQREVLEPMQQQQKATAEAMARQAVQSTITDLGLTDQDTIAAVLQLGDRYLDPNDLSPTAVSDAVKRGHEDFAKLVTANAQKYVAQKAQAKRTVPKSVGGGGASQAAQDEPEPKTVAEAIAAARRRMGMK